MSNMRRTDCPDEFELASYMAGILPSEERSALECHFIDCSECRRTLVEVVRMGPVPDEACIPVSLPRAWRRIEAALNKFDAESGDSINAGKVIPLFPRPLLNHQDDTGHALAAASIENEVPPLVTFTNEDGSILGKFLRDERTEEVSVFLIAEDMEFVRKALVRIHNPQAGFKAEGLADEYGVFPLGKAPLLRPDETSLELKMPDATFQLEPRKWRDHLVAESTLELSSPEGRTLRIELIERGVRREYRLDLSDLCAEQPECTLRVYVTDARHAEEVEVGPNGIAWLREQEPEAEHTTVRAYVVSP